VVVLIIIERKHEIKHNIKTYSIEQHKHNKQILHVIWVPGYLCGYWLCAIKYLILC